MKGFIDLDSKFGKKLGFTSDKFEGYLWKEGKIVIISFIVSKQEGKKNLSRLFDAIWKQGYTIQIPTPFPKMKAIALKKGFKKKSLYDDGMKEWVEILEKEPPCEK